MLHADFHNLVSHKLDAESLVRPRCVAGQAPSRLVKHGGKNNIGRPDVIAVGRDQVPARFLPFVKKLFAMRFDGFFAAEVGRAKRRGG